MKNKLTVGELFAGIGGFSVGLERTGGFRTVWQVETDDYANKVLAKHWPNVRRWQDVRTFPPDDGAEWAVDVITGGFPCQPFSCAGKRAGTEDHRWLWPEMFRIISTLKPTWVIAENVRGLLNLQDGMVFEQVLSDLEDAGYEVQAFVIPACAIDAPHRRDRVWIVGKSSIIRGQNQSKTIQKKNGTRPNAHGEGLGGRRSGAPRTEDVAVTSQELQHRAGNARPTGGGESSNSGQDVADAKESGLEGSDTERDSRSGRCAPEHGQGRWEVCRWLPEPDVGRAPDGFSTGVHRSRGWAGDWEQGVPRVATGVKNRVDRLKCLGNAVVPAVVEQIGYAILEAEEEPCETDKRRI